jgi:hypothetical protein
MYKTEYLKRKMYLLQSEIDLQVTDEVSCGIEIYKIRQNMQSQLIKITLTCAYFEINFDIHTYVFGYNTWREVYILKCYV